MLSVEEKQRYDRHIILPEIGEEGQKKLKEAKVLVIGAGGLGSPCLLYLASAGVGTIGIIDDDTVDLSNLQRQVLYSVDDIGQSKAICASEKLEAINPHIELIPYTERLTEENAISIFQEYDIIVDGSDNFGTRYLVNDACVITKKPLVFGSIFKFEGQVSVFNLEDGPTYRCLFPEPPEAGEMPSCSDIGVLGVLPGMVGSIQANEVIKLITEIGEPLKGRMLVLDALSTHTHEFSFGTWEANKEIQELKGVEYQCEIPTAKREIEFKELKELLESAEPPFLVDVRETKEREKGHLGGAHIPLSQFEKRFKEIPSDQSVVIYCERGQRSKQACNFLTEKGYINIKSLKQGFKP